MTAKEVIALLGLQPHPEGGFYRETWRDRPASGERGTGTAIYFLLPAGVTSAWHRVDAVEIWHWYAGMPLELRVSEGGKHYQTQILGQDVTAGQRPQAIVPKGAWQSAHCVAGVDGSSWTLVGCTVSPAFEFSGFVLAPADFTPILA